MTILLKALTTLSLLSLSHAIFSAYESTTLHPSTLHNQHTIPTIPLDIQIQTLVSTFALILCIVFSSAPLRPIRWAEWAGRIEREGWEPNAPDADERKISSGKGGAGNPYHMLEMRRGFWDVRASRREFAGWVREGGK